MALIDTQAVAVALDVPAATVRTWAKRGWLTRVGEDHKRRALYDTAQVEHLADLRRLAETHDRPAARVVDNPQAT